MTVRSILVAVLLCGTVLSGCLPASCEPQPFAGPLVGMARPPIVGDRVVPIAACRLLVSYEGNTWEVLPGFYEIPRSALTELGEASGANAAVGVTDPRVYSVEGVAPTDALVMIIRDVPTLMKPEGMPTPESACRYLIEPLPDCEPSPSP